MALLGRDNGSDPGLGSLLDEVAAASEHHHLLTLVAAAAASDQERLRAAVHHASPRVRSFALAHLGRLGLSQDAVRRVMSEGSAEDRRQVRRYVNRHRRTDLAEAVIDEVRRDLGDREAGALLATCAGPTVRRLLPELRYAVANLASLARRHPQALLDHLDAELRDLPQRRRDQLWAQVDPAVADLALSEPGRVLGLVEDVGPSQVVPWGLRPVLGFLIRFAPSRVAALVVDDEFVRSMRWQLPGGLRHSARRFSEADRIAVATALREHVDRFFEFISELPPGERATVFEHALADLDTSTTAWSSHSLDVLPRAVRHAEARRILDLRVIRDDDAATLEYTAVLPFAEARPILEVELRRPKAEDRGVGYRHLIACARRERTPEALAETLRLAQRLQNDQDPVRLTAFHALAAVSPMQVTDDHLADLGTLLRAAAEARDTSPGTIQVLVTFALRLLGTTADDLSSLSSLRPRFALWVIDELAGRTGSISFPRLDSRLPPHAAATLVDTLLPRLQQDAARGQYRLTLALARSLGRRAWRHDGLQTLLAQATRASDDAVVRTAIALWLDDPRARRERVAAVVARDESTVTLHPVLATINRSRQDLLDLVLRRTPLRGRFLDGDVRYVPVLHGGFERWLPRQCAAYRGALDQLIDAPGTSVRSVNAAIRATARLPGIGAEAIRRHLGSNDVARQEAALGALAWTDRPGESLGQLLTLAGTDRTRVAVYAATRCARFVPRPQLGPPLFAVLERDDAKVTARKEVARLVAKHRPPGWLDVLAYLGSREDTHRDVRIATGRALLGALDDDRAWSIYGRLSSAGDDEATSLLETVPTQIAPRHRPRYAELVVGTARSARPRPSSRAFTLLGLWAPWAAAAPAVAAAAIEDLGSGNRWRPALGALGQMLRDGTGWDEARRLVVTLAGRADGPDLDAGAERDRPSYQRLATLVQQMGAFAARDRASHRSEMLGIADVLGDSGSFHSEELVLRFATLDWKRPTAGLVALGPHLDEHPLLTGRALADLATALDRDSTMWTGASLGDPVDQLTDHASPGSGALAVALVEAAGTRYHWPDDWRSRLRALRAHRHTDVAALALALRTATE